MCWAMARDRLPEFRGKRNSFRARVLKAVRSLSMLSDSEKDILEEATQLSNSPLSLFFNRISNVGEILSKVEQKLVGLERLHRAHTSVHSQDQESFSLHALALHASRNIVSTSTGKEPHEIGIHEVYVLCTAARDCLEEVQIEASTKPFAQLSDFEKTIMKERVRKSPSLTWTSTHRYGRLANEAYRTVISSGACFQLIPVKVCATSDDNLYSLVSERLKDLRHRFGYVQANFQLYMEQRKELLAESTLQADHTHIVGVPPHDSSQTGYVTRADSQDTEWTVVSPQKQVPLTTAVPPTTELYTSLTDAAMQLRELRKIEAEALVVKRLFDDIAFFVDFQERNLTIAEQNTSDAKETIVIVANEISDKAEIRRKATKMRIAVALIGSLVVLSVVGGGLAYFSTGRPMPADFLGVLGVALLLISILVLICNKCAEQLLCFRFRRSSVRMTLPS